MGGRATATSATTAAAAVVLLVAVLGQTQQEVHCFNFNANSVNSANSANSAKSRRRLPMPTSTALQSHLQSPPQSRKSNLSNLFRRTNGNSQSEGQSQNYNSRSRSRSRSNMKLNMVTGPKGKAAKSKEDDIEKTVTLILQHDGEEETFSSSSSSSSGGLKEKLSSFLGGGSSKDMDSDNDKGSVKVKVNAVDEPEETVDEPELLVEMEKSAEKKEAETESVQQVEEVEQPEEVEQEAQDEITVVNGNINGNAEAETETETEVEATTAVAIVKDSEETKVSSSSSSPKIASILSMLTSCFPLFVLSAAITGFKQPQLLSWVNKGQIIPIMLGAVMTFMGMTLSTKDFQNIITPSKDIQHKQSSSSLSSIPIGVLCQYLIMPLSAYAIGSTLLLPSHPAAFLGLLLVGCSPGGTASNLVSLIAKADVALSVVLTSASTLMASILTPLLVKSLIGSTVAISGKVLCKATAQVILGPIVLGMSIRKILPGLATAVGHVAPFAGVVLVSLLCGGVVAQNAALFLAGGAAGAEVALLKKIVWSVLGLHSIGFAMGYILPRKVFGLSERSARTISIETGMQNSALAVVLAKTVVSTLDAPSSALMALAMLPGAMSATAHSCLGSALAVYWRFVDGRKSAGREGGQVQPIKELVPVPTPSGIEGTTIVEEDSGSGI